MALPSTRRQQLAQMMLPNNDTVQTRLRSFLLQSGMNQREFGEAIGFSSVAINHFLNGKYGAHHVCDVDMAGNLKSAAIAFMDQHELRQENLLRGEHFETSDFVEATACAFDALSEGNIYVIDGPPGSQKSWCLMNIEREINQSGKGRAIYLYSRDRHTKQTFLQELCRVAGVPNGGGIDKLLQKLKFFLASQRIVFLIDEGQHLCKSALEVLRQLIDLSENFGLVLAGSHDLTYTLQHYQMEQWRRRTVRTLRFTGPSKAEARRILASQLDVTDKSQADEVIADCMAEAHKHDGTRLRKYEYVSAGLLFAFIAGMKKEALQLQESAA